MTTGTVSSPCIGQCKINHDGLCQGCFRTRDELRQWLGFTEQQRLTVMQRCKKRQVASQ